jgi:hypothetical protein
MSFTQSFSVLQSPQSPALLFFKDTSTGSDISITSRRIYIQGWDGNFIVPVGTTTDYIVWPLLDIEFTVDVFTQDTAANVKVDWLDDAGTVLYSANDNYCFSEYNKQFFYYLIQQQSLTYNVVQDGNYFTNLGVYWINIVSATNSIVIGNDIYASQVCLNRATNMMDNQSYFF